MKKLAKEWLESAFADLKSIEYLLQDDYLTHIVAFHSQQCVEKSFKALLEYNDKIVPKQHSTLRLYGMVKDFINFEVDENLLSDFDDLYIESRYPGSFGLLPNGKPSLEDAKEFYSFSKYIYENVKNLIEDER